MTTDRARTPGWLCSSRGPPFHAGLLDAWIETLGEFLARGEVEIEEGALLDRRQLEAGSGQLGHGRLPVLLEPAPELFVGRQPADHLLYASVRHRHADRKSVV